MKRRQRNKIDGLVVDGEWCFEDDVLRQHVVSFFQALFTVDYEVRGNLSCSVVFPVVSTEDLGSLLLVASNEEVRRAVFSMAPLKAPGVDGFQAKFF